MKDSMAEELETALTKEATHGVDAEPDASELSSKEKWNLSTNPQRQAELAAEAEKKVEEQQQAKAQADKAEQKKLKQAIDTANGILNAAFDKRVTVECGDLDELIDSLPEEHAALIDQSEVTNGERLGVISDGTLTFTRACDQLNMPFELREAYKEWLSAEDRPGTPTPPSMLGDKRGTFIPKGMNMPKPNGKKWRCLKNGIANKFKQRPLVWETINAFGCTAVAISCDEANAFIRGYLAVEENIDNNQVIIEANRAKLRAKDAHEGILPAPKGMKGMLKHPENTRWIAALQKELSSLTEIGSVTHMHSAEELLEMGVDIMQTPPAYCHAVFENKLMMNDITGQTELEKAKARVVLDGNLFIKGLHYEEGYSPTPRVETSRLICALRVLLALHDKQYDVSNAYCHAGRKKKIALHYPRGMEQYGADGRERFMLLHSNHYGGIDGSYLWDDERDTKYAKFYSRPGWTFQQSYMDPCLFRVGRHAVALDTAEEEDDGMLTKEEAVGDMNVDSWCLMLIHSDDHDLVSTSKDLNQHIRNFANKTWGVRDTEGKLMLGVKRTATEKNGVRALELTMPSHVEGTVKAFSDELTLAGYNGKKQVHTPFPEELHLSLWDPFDEVSDDMAAAIKAKGYSCLVGLLHWIARMCFPECKVGVHMLQRVLSRPSDKAWKAAMHMLQWVSQHPTRGIMFRSDGNKTPICNVDASNKQDWKDGLVMYGYDVRLANGPIITETGKLKNTGFGTPAVEHMAMAEAVEAVCKDDLKMPLLSKDAKNDSRMLAWRWSAASVMWLRQLLKEIGLQEMVKDATHVYSDSKGAVDWMRFRKITPANHYILIAYHQRNEWVQSKDIELFWKRGTFNTADLLTKSVTRQVILRLMMKYLGYELNIPGEADDDTDKLDRWMKSAGTISQVIKRWKLQ